ncbi:MAG: gluconokinase [Verrucomicrobiota bacterium]
MSDPASASPAPRTLIVMGVCGCGKTLIGTKIAEKLGGVFEDADHFHSEANKKKMNQGIPLTDEDRWPWYATLRARIEEMRGKTPVYVLACSALKAVYREKLRAGDDDQTLVFVHLEGSRELIFGRMSAREGHYMPVSLLDSQFAILEPTEDLIAVSIEGTPEEIVEAALAKL